MASQNLCGSVQLKVEEHNLTQQPWYTIHLLHNKCSCFFSANLISLWVRTEHPFGWILLSWCNIDIAPVGPDFSGTTPLAKSEDIASAKNRLNLALKNRLNLVWPREEKKTRFESEPPVPRRWCYSNIMNYSISLQAPNYPWSRGVTLRLDLIHPDWVQPW